jgi:hypothetical protein
MDDLRLYGRSLEAGEIFTLFDGEPPVLQAPQLSSPVNGNNSVIAPEALLSWSAAEFAAGYQVQLALDNGFEAPLIDNDTGEMTEFLATALLPETNYFWRVRSRNSEGNSEWSEIWTFLTVGEGNVPEGPVGHWKMDEGSGNTLIDHSGNGNNALLQSTSGVSWTEGINGLALNLDGGSGRFANAAHNSSLEITEALTIAAWVRPSVLGRNTIVSKADGNGFELWLDINGLIEFRLNRGNNGSTYRLVSNYNYTADIGNWIHVAATFDGTTSKIYINGIEDVSKSYPPFTIGTASGDLVIGALGTIQRFKGSMDDLRLYGRSLEAGEITELVQSGSVFRKKGSTLKTSTTGMESTNPEEFGSKELLEGNPTLYPNPVDDDINLLLGRNFSGIVDIQIFDTKGRLILERKVGVEEQSPIPIDLRPYSLAPGNYILFLHFEGKREALRFIKK